LTTLYCSLCSVEIVGADSSCAARSVNAPVQVIFHAAQPPARRGFL
jgi:hypothetical protein